MSKIVYFVIVSLFSILIFGCEKVIDVPLNEADQRIVVEGVFKDQPGNNFVMLSKTGSVYEDSNFEKISGAIVTVTDELGTLYTLTEVSGEPGKYTHATLQILPDNFYTLNIGTGTTTLTSTCETFSTPQLDGLDYIEQVGTFGVGTDTTYLVFFSFTDDGSQENYYRIVAWVNGARDGNYYVSSDDLFNGQPYTQPIFATTVEKGDTVLIELQSMDKANYTYMFGLSTGAGDGGDPFAPTPANPVSNIGGGGIGYFGSYTTDTLTIILPE